MVEKRQIKAMVKNVEIWKFAFPVERQKGFPIAEFPPLITME
jgi:hypothetical protein